MRKVISVFLCILLLAALAVTVSATASAQMTVSAGKTTVNPGETIDFSVSISSVEDCRSAAFMLTYDQSVFEFVGGKCTLSGTALANFSAGTGTFAYGSGTAVSGQIFTFQLKVKNDAAIGNYNISANVNTRDSNGAIPTSVNSLRISVACKHNYGAWTETGAAHQQVCANCGDVRTENHDWKTAAGSVAPTCKEEGRNNYACAVCGASKTEVVTKTENHTYGSAVKVDDASHKNVCSVCAKEVTQAHTWNSGTVTKPATCKEEGVKTYTCTGCGASKTETVAKLTTHTYDHGCDTNCNICGQTRTTTHNYSSKWSKDQTGHWYECSECKDKKDSAAHTPGAAATESKAQTCTVCGYVIKAALGHKHSFANQWTTDEKGHWYVCSGCDEQGSYADHSFENACDTDCAVCGYTRKTAHTYAEKWENNADSHWKLCTGCGEKAEEATHVAEVAQTGAKVCSVCALELAPAPEVPETDPTVSTQPAVADPTEVTEPVGTEEKSFPVWIILVIAAVAVAGVVCFMAVKKKK